MKKRLLSLSLVLVIVFTGAFSCLASAASRSPGEFLFDKYWELIHKGEQAIEDIWNIGRETREDAERELRQILFDQKDGAGNPPPSSSYTYTYICADGRAAVYDISPDTLRSLYSDFQGCYLFAYISSAPFDYVKNYNTNVDLGNLVVYAVPASSADYVSSSYNGSSFSLSSSRISYYRSEITFTIKDGSPFLRNRFINSYSVAISLTGSYSEDTKRNNIFFYSEFDNQSLTFTGTFSASDDLVCTVESSRPLTPQDGSFSIMTGILYDDGIDITYAGSFVNTASASSGQRWSWSYDLDDFAYYVYRKRCGLDNYYAFISVTQGSDTYYFVTMPLEINKPGGVFDDTEDPPSWDDYRPEPSPAPDFPDITFDYHPNNNYQTINNYTVDANSTFNDYFTYFVDASQTINNNVNIISDNVIQFGNAVQDFVEDGESACLDYIGELITKFNTDFNDRIDAISEFIGDQFDTLNHNIGVIGDNIVKAIKTQAVPDQEVVINILNNHFPGFSDIQSGFDEFEPVSDDLVVSIPLLSSNSSAAGSSDPESFVIGFDSSSGDYVFNISDQFSDPMYSRLRELMRIFVLGSTFIGAVNVFLKIFGLGFSSKDDD